MSLNDRNFFGSVLQTSFFLILSSFPELTLLGYYPLGLAGLSSHEN